MPLSRFGRGAWGEGPMISGNNISLPTTFVIASRFTAKQSPHIESSGLALITDYPYSIIVNSGGEVQ
jgi:hypothetical protein